MPTLLTSAFAAPFPGAVPKVGLLVSGSEDAGHARTRLHRPGPARSGAPEGAPRVPGPPAARGQETGRSAGCIFTAQRPELMSAKKMLPFQGITPHAAAAFGM